MLCPEGVSTQLSPSPHAKGPKTMARGEHRAIVALTAAVVVSASGYYIYRQHFSPEARARREAAKKAAEAAFDQEQIRLKIELARLAAEGNLASSSAEGGGIVSLTPERCGGTTSKYTWTQDEREIVVRFQLDSELRSRDCLVNIATKSLNVVVDGVTLLEGELTRRVSKDDSYWELEEDDSTSKKKTLSITLTKLRRTYAKFHWPSVCLGEPETDVSSFGDPVVGVNGHNPSNGNMQAAMEEVEAMRRDAETA